MKALSYFAAALLLSSCATQSPTEAGTNSERIRIHFTGAKDDRFPELHLEPQAAFEKSARNGDIEQLSFPLSYAIACNATKSTCKHAVVKTQLKLTTYVTSGGLVQVSGALLSEMGRTLSLSSPPSSTYSQTTLMAVPNEVEVIAELKNELPFERVMRAGEKFSLRGLGGAEVALEIK